MALLILRPFISGPVGRDPVLKQLPAVLAPATDARRPLVGADCHTGSGRDNAAPLAILDSTLARSG